MDREIYVMVDSVSGIFGEPFTMANDAELRREFEQTLKSPAVPAYTLRDVVVLHLGTLHPDRDNPCIIPAAIPCVVIRGGSYNVEEIRKQVFNDAAAASVLPSGECCETPPV